MCEAKTEGPRGTETEHTYPRHLFHKQSLWENRQYLSYLYSCRFGNSCFSVAYAVYLEIPGMKGIEKTSAK